MKLHTLLLWTFWVWISWALIEGKKVKNKSLVEAIDDHKEFKKLLRTKNNVLVAFLNDPKSGREDLTKLLNDVAEAVKGIGTIATVDCQEGHGKKLCKKLKVNQPILKHYQNGEFHLDYHRKERLQTMVNFMKDPKGDLPWEEDDSARDVLHILDVASFNKLLKKEKDKDLLVMFHAPWCGFCKRMKPDFQEAATEIKGSQGRLVAVDITKPGNNGLSRKYNVTGFPTLLYFKNGAMKYTYPGENKKKSIVDFMTNPSPDEPVKVKELAWSDEPSNVIHLTDATFDQVLAEEPSLLVMFYAPWCGHCKRMKPQFTAASGALKLAGIAGKLAAVDCTVERELGSRFEVKGYPSVKYFKDGALAFEAGHVREENDIVAFMKDPREPPPPPPPEKPWSEEESEVHHLDTETFKPFLKKKKHVLVFFYAPWCGHCKKAKPEFTDAAAEFADNVKVEFVAVDCTQERSLCSTYEIKGYPTLKYFKYFDKQPVLDYDGGRTQADFVRFMKDPDSPAHGKPPPPPSPKEQWSGIEGGDHVLILTAENFKSDLERAGHALVMFHAPWCGHCKNMKPDFAAAAKELETNNNLALGAVDATIEGSLAKQFDVRGYPTLKYFRKGVVAEQEYEGGRRKSDFLAFLKGKVSKDEL